jgi:O-methyltransferase involved in polyketide biosynthesis
LQPPKSTLVLLEGVSPYIDARRWRGFLEFLVRMLPAGSLVAYDFKVPGVDAQFGSSERTMQPFRLSGSADEVAAYHAQLGFRVDSLRSSAQLARSLLKEVPDNEVFEEDALVQLSV